MKSHITFDTAKLAKEKHYMDGNRISKLFPKLGYVNCSPCYDEKECFGIVSFMILQIIII